MNTATDRATADMLQALIESPTRALPYASPVAGTPPSVTAFEWWVDQFDPISGCMGEPELRDLLDLLREIERTRERVPMTVLMASRALLAWVARSYGEHVGPDMEAEEERLAEVEAMRPKAWGVML